MRIRIALGAALAVTAAAALSGCTAADPNAADTALGAAAANPVTSANVADPNHADGVRAGAYPLTATPDVRAVVGWRAGSLAPGAGWTVEDSVAQAGSGDTLSGTRVAKTAPRTALTAQSRDGSCTLAATTAYLDAYNHGKGDLYLSKQSLYSALEDGGSLARDESSALLTTTRADHPLQFLTATFAAPKAEITTDAGKKMAGPHGLIAVRAIDSVTANPYTAAQPKSAARGAFGSDPKRGLPVLTVRYACTGSAQPVAAVWSAALKSLRVQLP